MIYPVTDTASADPPALPSYYRCKVKDPKLYNQMSEAMFPFKQPERLAKLLHLNDTQLNEAMNQSFSKYVPQNKTFSTTMLLNNCIVIAIGIQNYGHHRYWKEVLIKLGMKMTETLSSHLKKDTVMIIKRGIIHTSVRLNAKESKLNMKILKQ